MCHSTTLMCHCEERSDVAISGRKLRFRRWLSRDSTGYGEIATAPLGPRNDKLGGIAHSPGMPPYLQLPMALAERRYRRNRCIPF